LQSCIARWTSTAHWTGFDHAREFDQEAIASCLDDTALVLGDLRVDELSPMRLECR
jgi:hypothetical protein